MQISMIKINELAKKLDVTRQNINYHIKVLNIQPTKINGVNFIEEDDEVKITNRVLESRQIRKNENVKNDDFGTPLPSEQIRELHKTLRAKEKDITFLQEQAKQKDEQIKQLQKALEKEQFIAIQHLKKSQELEQSQKHLQAPANANGVKKGAKRGLLGKLIDLI